jgi:hypothetical protein
MMLIVRRPFHLRLDEAEQWLREATVPLLEVHGVERLTASRLASAGGCSSGHWRIELELAEWSDPARIVRAEPCAVLLGDLRMLGMRPSLSMVEVAWEAER